MMKPLLPLLIVLLSVPLFGQPVDAQSEREEGWLAATRRVDGRNEIWVSPAGGGPWQRLRTPDGDLRSPTWHPDGHHITYTARRNRNWDIYSLDLRTGEEARLTSSDHFEGWPAWSPDGRQLAYSLMRDGGDLDVMLFDLATGDTRNLTPDSAAHDFEPRWEDDDHLLFVSTRNETHDVFRLNINNDKLTSLATSPERAERQMMPLPNGEMLVIAKEDRKQTVTWRAPDEGRTLSLTGAAISAAISPDGTAVAWLERRTAGDILYRRTVEGGETIILNGPTPRLGELAWGTPDEADLREQLSPPAAPTPTPASESGSSDLVRVPGLTTEAPRLNDRVLTSFQRLRARVAGETGRDFLGTVSEAARPVHFSSSTSDYLSWHKAGYAFDTLLDLGWQGNHEIMEIVREDRHGEVYWRLWLRCSVQDGSCGEPLVDAPWDLSTHARVQVAPGEGGVPKSHQAGYYVDFSQLAEDGGWQRIASYELPDFDWRENLVALEYWHFQRTGGQLWYDVIQDVYSRETIDEWFNWDKLREHEISRWLLREKGVPLPPEVRHAPAEIVIP